jgi:hypothetical protein
MGGTSSSGDLWTRLESLNRQMTWSQIGARRKILDLPFVTAALSGLNWLLAALVMTVHQLLVIAEPNQPAVELFWLGAKCIYRGYHQRLRHDCHCFFGTERDCRHIRPYFFPEGGLDDVPGALKL